jgi:uncharacterized protein YabE (DUF348 family)
MFKKMRDFLSYLRRFIIGRSVAVPVISAVTVVCITVSVSSLNTYIVYDGDRVSVLNSYSENWAAALNEMGITLSDNDLVSMPEQPENGISKMHILRAGEAQIDVDGKSIAIPCYNENVMSVLTRAGVAVSQNDIVTPTPETPVTDGMRITVTRVRYEKSEEYVKIPFTTEKRASDKLETGKQRVVQKGASGNKRCDYEVKFVNNEIAEKKLVGETVVKAPVKKIIEYGTKPVTASGGVLNTGAGKLKYKKVLEVTATAYSTERWKKKTTATGAVARYGLIAVDPKVIPLGTKLYITSLDGKSWIYGTAVAADTGGSIKGNKIDLCFNTHNECIKFGRKKARVYILE